MNNENQEDNSISIDDSTGDIKTKMKSQQVINKQPSGILRLDIGKPRRSSGGSVEFRNQPELLGGSSEEREDCNNDRNNEKDSSSSSTTETLIKSNLEENLLITNKESLSNDKPYSSIINTETVLGTNAGTSYKKSHYLDEKKLTKKKSFENFPVLKKEKSIKILPPIYMESVSPVDIPVEFNDSEEDADYSLSVSAIMQRRASVRGYRTKKGYRSPRRTSSPLSNIIAIGSNDRRRSSVYTTSSGETAISIEDGTQESTQEQIFENIRLHKEVLQSVKMQPWSMRRKLRLVSQAKAYVARHEGALQERFAMSRSTRDLMARFRILLATRCQHYRRELANLSTVLIPWEVRIKEIESHFGSVVASYFTFLRWLFWVNIVIAVVLTVFVVVPELLTTDPAVKDDRKQMLPEEKAIASNLITIWDFEGFLKYSPLFYGFYSDFSGAVRWGYRLPLAYFLTGIAVYIYSFVATLRKMAENSRMSKLSSKDDECVFSWKIFTGWDFMIGHAETAHNRVASVVLGFKEALLEEAEKKKDKRNWRVIALRIFVNLMVMLLLAISAYAVVEVVNRSTDATENDSWWRRNEITIVMSLISFFFPMIFEGLGFMESYHPRQQLRLQLARIMLLNLLNLYSLIFALFDKISDMTVELSDLKRNITMSIMIPPRTTTPQMFPHMTDYQSNGNDIDYLQMTTAATFLNITEVLPTMISVSNVITNSYNEFEDVTKGMMENITTCYQVLVNCTNNENSTLATTLLLFNLTTILPELWAIKRNEFNNLNITGIINDTEIFTNISINDDSIIENFTLKFDNFLSENETELSWLDDNDFVNKTAFKKHRKRQVKDQYEEYNYDDDDDDDEDGEDNYFESENHDNNNLLLDMEKNGSKDSQLLNYDKINIYDYVSNIFANLNNDHTIYNQTNIINGTNITEIIEENLQNFIDNITNNNYNSTNITNFINENLNFMLLSMENGINENTNRECYIRVCETTKYFDEPSTENSPPNMDTSAPTFRTFINQYLNNDITTELSTNQNIQNFTIDPYRNYEKYLTTETKDTFDGDSTMVIDLSLPSNMSQVDMATQMKLKKLCWETMFGQELVKLTVMDLVVTISSTLLLDFFRALFVRYMNKCWCWDLEKKYPKYGDFKIAENILHLVNNQGMVWMGMFFSPGLAVLNLAKLVVIMYLRSWAVLTCNVPHEVVFRASRSNNFYLALLLTMLFLCVLPVAYAIVWLEPSWHCGPFSKHKRIYLLFTETLRNALPQQLHKPLDYIASPSTVIPLLLLLVLIIYYLISLTGALREANQDLKNQLRRERTEERRKMFKIPDNQPSEPLNAPSAISARWRKVLENPTPLTPTGAIQTENDENKIQARKELLARIMKKALRKGSATSDDDSNAAPPVGDDETDTEQHDSLPHDQPGYKGAEKAYKERRNSIHHTTKAKETDNWIKLLRARAMKSDQQQKPVDPKSTGKNSSDKTEKDEKVVKENKKEGNNHSKSRSKSDHTSKIIQNVISKFPQKAEPEAECDAGERVVNERRKSLLKRQNKFNESDDSQKKINLEDNYNYDEIEKKKRITKSIDKNSSTEPEIFKFDEESLGKSKITDKKLNHNIGDSSDDNTSYMDIIPMDKNMQDKGKLYETTSHEVSPKYNENSTNHRGMLKKKRNHHRVKHSSSPDHKSNKTKPMTDTSSSRHSEGSEDEYNSRPIKHQVKLPTIHKNKQKSSPAIGSKLPEIAQQKEQGKGMRKFNNFITLVREAVAKKPESDLKNIDQLEKGETTLRPPVDEYSDEMSPLPTKNIFKKRAIEAHAYRNKTNKVQPVVVERHAKRQDSVTSIWSDNIPVITISKTESDECILKSDDETGTGTVKRKKHVKSTDTSASPTSTTPKKVDPDNNKTPIA